MSVSVAVLEWKTAVMQPLRTCPNHRGFEVHLAKMLALHPRCSRCLIPIGSRWLALRATQK